ncbi:hypothetical protein [Niabella sp.]|uniref:plasmid mobilization protein n=1 Tax=Niabella sp. TaxID=1962976 RepID=UPI00262DE151|nr:hypothetical protein [Niabella sp.]
MRRKVNDKEALKYDIKLRVNQRHFDRLSKMLSESHYRNMSELLRDIVCERKVVIYTRDESISVVMEELSRIRKELNAIGNNTNQAAKQINATVDKNKILVFGVELSEQHRQVLQLTEQLFPIISQLAKKWLRG